MDINTLDRMSNLNTLQIIVFIIIQILCLQLFDTSNFITIY